MNLIMNNTENDMILWDIEQNEIIVKENSDWYITIQRIIKIEKIKRKLDGK